MAAVVDPRFQLPWPTGQSWFFTNGPHKAWGAGTPWGALDFQPPNSIGCSPMEATSWWARPVAQGKVTLVDTNRIEIDHENGWQTMYYHISDIKVAVNQRVDVGTDLGRPSCYPAGSATGRGIHLAIKRDGSWIDFRTVPVNLSGWSAKSDGTEGGGTMVRGTTTTAIYGLLTNDGLQAADTPTPSPTSMATGTPTSTASVSPTTTRSPSSTPTPLGTNQIQIAMGWNIISVPAPQQDPAIAAVFADTPTISKVYGYADGKWDFAQRSGDTWLGSLTQIVDGRGYFVFATSAPVLTFHSKPADGSAPPRSYPLPAGWSLIGYSSSLVSMPVENYLSSLQGTWTVLYRYDALNGWAIAKPGGLGFKDVEMGRGYWINLSAAGTLSPS